MQDSRNFRNGSSRTDPRGQRARTQSNYSAAPLEPKKNQEPSVGAHRAALEALFEKKAPPPPEEKRRELRKVVPVGNASDDPRVRERERLLGKLLAAEGRAAVTRTADEFVKAGFTLPSEEDVLVKLLDHADSSRVFSALEALSHLLDSEPPKRRGVMEARLKHIEECADDSATSALATQVRKLL